MTRLVIAGAGGFGRGLAGWISQSARHREKFQVSDIVFIDDAVDSSGSAIPVLGTIRDYEACFADEIIVAMGNPQVRQKVVRNLRERGANFHTFIDDRAIIGECVKVGAGAIICPGTVISANATIGEQVHINFNCSVGHDTVLGKFTTLSPSVNVMGEVRVGEEVFLGGSATILPRTSLADRVIVGAGSVLVNGAPREGATLIGNPARTILTSNVRGTR